MLNYAMKMLDICKSEMIKMLIFTDTYMWNS